MPDKQDKVPMHVVNWAGKIQAVLFDRMSSSFPHHATVEADGWAIHLAKFAGDCAVSFRKLPAEKSDD